MKQAVQSDAKRTQKASTATARGRPARPQAASGHLTQLAAMMNGSSRVQGLAQAQDHIQRSRIAQTGLDGTAQRKIEVPGTLAHSDRISDGLKVAEGKDGSGQSSDQSSCGCTKRE